MKKNMYMKGFTLIELLIVIALLGALAIGLIGAIDPFEQLKKGPDTGTRNVVSEVQSAIIRYYALKNGMPWCPTGGCTVAGSTYVLTQSLSAAAATGYLSKIVESGELKSNFTTLQSGELNKVFVTGTDSQAVVCYQPASKSFRSDLNTKFDRDGTEHSGSPACGTTDTTACFWCVR